VLLILSREKVALLLKNINRSNRQLSFTTNKIPFAWHRLLVEGVEPGVREMDKKNLLS
jgi:hypothetical protein